MSKENVKRFQDELTGSKALQKKLKDINPSSLEDLVSFAAKAGFIFTVDEFKEMQQVTEKGTVKLSEEELARVSAGKDGGMRCPKCGSTNTWITMGGRLWGCYDCGWDNLCFD